MLAFSPQAERVGGGGQLTPQRSAIFREDTHSDLPAPSPFLTQEAPGHSTEHFANHRGNRENTGKPEDQDPTLGCTTDRGIDLGQGTSLLRASDSSPVQKRN